jgi:hypothetical protein
MEKSGLLALVYDFLAFEDVIWRPAGARMLAPVISWIGRRQEQAIWENMKRYLETPQPRP